MSFITGLGYFVSWGSYNDQTCFLFLAAVSSELLTGAPIHVDKHKWPEGKVIMCAIFVVYVRNIVFGYWPLSKPGLFLWKRALKHSKENFVSGWLKLDEVPGNGGFYTLHLGKTFHFRELCPPTPHQGVAPGPYRGPQKAPGHPLSGFLTFLYSHIWLWKP